MPVDWFWVLRFGQIFGKICDFCCWSRVVRRRAWCICCDGSLAMCTVFIHTPRTIIHKTCTKTRKHPQKSVDIRITTHTHMVVLGLCWFVLKSWNHVCSVRKSLYATQNVYVYGVEGAWPLFCPRFARLLSERDGSQRTFTPGPSRAFVFATWSFRTLLCWNPPCCSGGAALSP